MSKPPNQPREADTRAALCTPWCWVLRTGREGKVLLKCGCGFVEGNPSQKKEEEDIFLMVSP